MKKSRELGTRISGKMLARRRVFAAIGIVAWLTVFVLFIKNKPDLRVPTEQASCNNYCQTKFGTDGYLKKLHETLTSEREQMRENLSAGRNREYSGPWRCICQSE